MRSVWLRCCFSVEVASLLLHRRRYFKLKISISYRFEKSDIDPISTTTIITTSLLLKPACSPTSTMFEINCALHYGMQVLWRAVMVLRHVLEATVAVSMSCLCVMERMIAVITVTKIQSFVKKTVSYLLSHIDYCSLLDKFISVSLLSHRMCFCNLYLFCSYRHTRKRQTVALVSFTCHFNAILCSGSFTLQTNWCRLVVSTVTFLCFLCFPCRYVNIGVRPSSCFPFIYILVTCNGLG